MISKVLKYHPVLLLITFCALTVAPWQLQNDYKNVLRKGDIERSKKQLEKKTNAKQSKSGEIKQPIKFPSIFHAFT
jgi:hypothetical protein